MSKQTEAKTKQGYVPKLTPQACMNCASFKFDMVPTNYPPGYAQEKQGNLRCAIGGFAVKKMGTCDEWKPQPAQN